MKKIRTVTQVIKNIATIIETAISIFLIIVMITLMVRLVFDARQLLDFHTKFSFDEFFSLLINVVIGIEFARMLCLHTPESVIEVLLFTISKQMLLAHNSIWEPILGAVSIAILFAVQKLFLTGSVDKITSESIKIFNVDSIGK